MLRRCALPVALVVLLAGCTTPTPPGGAPPGPPPIVGTLRVTALDVGDGDATLIELPKGALLLVGCGPAAGSADENPVVQFLEAGIAPAQSKLLGLFVAHTSGQHAGGCAEVAQHFYFQNLYDASRPGSGRDDAERALRSSVRAENGTIHTLQANDTLGGGTPFTIGPLELPTNESAAGVRLDVLAVPNATAQGLALRVGFGAQSVCLLPASDAAEEEALTQACDALITSPRAALGAPLLARLQSQWNVLSIGPTPPSPPDAPLLCRLDTNAALLTTHRAGDVVITMEGGNLTTPTAFVERGTACSGASFWRPDGTMVQGPDALQVKLEVRRLCNSSQAQVDATVEDADGSPSAGARVAVRWLESDGAPLDRAVADARGNVSVTRNLGMAPGEPRVDARAWFGTAVGEATAIVRAPTCA